MIIAFAPTTNKPGINAATGRPWKDATGAFIPEAKAFIDHHKKKPAGEAELVMIDNTKSEAAMREKVLAELARPRQQQLHGVAFFCHGMKDRIQLGIRKVHIPDLVSALRGHTELSVSVTFYACDAARDDDGQRDDDLAEFGGDNGFADKVRDELCVRGLNRCVVDAHTTAAHTTKNPHVRRFEGMGSSVGGVGGYYIAPQKSASWKKWVALLKTDFRFEFPYMSTADIHLRLAK